MVDSCLAGNLLELLAQIPDPRDRRGRRHPLVAMLATIVCAVLTGSRGYRAIAQWARSQSPTVWQWLGFRRKPPCANSFRNLLLALKPEVLESILRQWMAAAVQLPPPDTVQAVAIDGKTLCNTLAAHQRNVHLLSLFDQATGGVLSQQAVPPTTNESKTAVELLKTILLKGRLVTGEPNRRFRLGVVDRNSRVADPAAGQRSLRRIAVQPASHAVPDQRRFALPQLVAFPRVQRLAPRRVPAAIPPARPAARLSQGSLQRTLTLLEAKGVQSGVGAADPENANRHGKSTQVGRPLRGLGPTDGTDGSSPPKHRG